MPVEIEMAGRLVAAVLFCETCSDPVVIEFCPTETGAGTSAFRSSCGVEEATVGAEGLVVASASVVCAAGACCETEGDDEDGDEGDGVDEVAAADPGVCAMTLGLWRKYIAPAATNPNITTAAPANINTDELRLSLGAGWDRGE